MRSSLLHLARSASTTRISTAVNASTAQIPGQTIYLTHVNWFTGKAQLEQYFGRYGRVQHVTMFFDAQTGLHRGFASLTFDSKEGARRAMEERPHVIDGDRVDVEPFIPRMRKKQQQQQRSDDYEL